MATSTQLSTDETFFQGFFSEPDANVNNHENNGLNETKAENKNVRKSKRAKSVENVESKVTNSQKEMSILKISKCEKSKSSIKPARQPLKVLFSISETKKKNESPKTEESTKNVSEEVNPTTEGRVKKEENRRVSGVIVYEDEGESEASGAEAKAENFQPLELPAGAKGLKVREKRRSAPPRKSRSLGAAACPRPGKNRYTLNDLSGLKCVSERMKKAESVLPFGAAEKKSPAQSGAEAKLPPDKVDQITNNLEATDLEFLTEKKKKKGELPPRADHARKQAAERLEERYKENFSVESFLKMIPHPREYFSNLERTTSVRYADHSLHYLKKKFRKHYSRTIQYVLATNEYSLYLSDKQLRKKCGNMRRSNRSKAECDAGKPLAFDVHFMHEVLFIENESKINSYARKSEAAKSKRFQRAKETGALQECLSCCDYNLLLEDVVTCSAAHVFCKECVARYADIKVEDKNFSFKCLTKCEENFSKETLEKILGPAIIASIIGGLQSQEFKPEGIDNLVCCPFCYHVLWASSEEDAVLLCCNPGCAVEFCRYCKQQNHAPRQCNELENVGSKQSKPEDDVIDTPPICRTRVGCEGGGERKKAGRALSGDVEFVGTSGEEGSVGDEILGGGDSDLLKSGTDVFPSFLSTDSISF